ncbi:unnamed protein product [Rhizoctonia solani]|uniref:Protein kinase domain-containing protein n=1 Tax=Rhizoctonia solani TaxID=456999 RepID=A0A8H3D3H5_9AGAM|nr:unnamed protein product [Rhizoctonia solani]
MDVTNLLDLHSVPFRLIGSLSVSRGRLLNGTDVAINTVAPSWQKRMLEVLPIWAKCSHPNIVQLIGKATFQGQLAAVYGWHEYRGIQEYLKCHSTADRYHLSTQISDGVSYLHGIGIIHGNLDGGLKAPELAKIGTKRTLASDVYALGMETITWNEAQGLDSVWTVFHKAKTEPPPRPINTIPVNNAGDVVWDILSKCWSINPETRPSANHVCHVMNTVYQSPDGVAPKPLRLVVREDTTVQDLVAHFEKQGLINYTGFLDPSVIVSSILAADTALANVYRVEMYYHVPVAVKCVKHITPYKRLKRAARELDCWLSHQHDNVLPLFGFAVIGEDLAMISPWMNNGCVTDYVASHPTCDRHGLCTQLAQAIAYLHEYNVVHGDIKGPNVLISDRGTVQVTDFGVSIVDHQEIEFSITASGRGTQRWQESGLPYKRRMYSDSVKDGDSSKEADVYALGMTMIVSSIRITLKSIENNSIKFIKEIYTGERPYGSMNWSGRMSHNIISGQLRPSRPIELPIDATGGGIWELMTHCWEGDPNNRPTSSEVYERLRSF